MSKSILYIVIILLAAVVLYLLFMPQQTAVAPVTTEDEAKTEVLVEAAAETVEENKSADETDESEVKTGTIEFSGILVGFGDGKDQFLGSYKTALINDGIEVVAIDLRPLVGYDVTSLESDLGISIGSVVEVRGELIGEEFVVTSIR